VSIRVAGLHLVFNPSQSNIIKYQSISVGKLSLQSEPAQAAERFLHTDLAVATTPCDSLRPMTGRGDAQQMNCQVLTANKTGDMFSSLFFHTHFFN